MNRSISILRQGDWDLWVGVCVAASLVLVTYAVAGKLWKGRAGRLALGMIVVAVGGTVALLAFPATLAALGSLFNAPGLRLASVGIFWTFLTLALLSAVFYLNLRPQLGTAKTLILLGVRVLALALIVLMLFGPVLRYSYKPKPERPLLFLVDASGSMSFPDVQNGLTRMQSLWQVLRPQLPKIRDNFVPEFYTFATDFREIKDPEEFGRLNPDGQATDIAKGLSRVLTRAGAGPHALDAQVILVSDGIDNVSTDPTLPARGTPYPIHTVLVGSEQAEPATLANVAVENVEAADEFVVNHESKVKATIKSTALGNRVVDVKMAEVDAGGKTVGEIKSAKLVLQSNPAGQTMELGYKPKTAGIHRLAVWVDPVPGERSTVDNRQEFQGLALDPRIKVLYVEGRLRPEYKPLKDALEHDQNIELATLLQVTPGVFKANGKVDGEDVAKAGLGMPQSPADWKKFDVVILGDLPADVLNPTQQAAIEQAVADGAGLLMIGGQSNFGPGGYGGTPVEKALPVLVGDKSAPQEKSEFVPRLTAEGSGHPAMEGLGPWFGVEETAGAKPLPPLRGNVVVRGPKAGAQVLLTHPGRPGPDGKPQIVLAVQRYGQGRAGAFTADTTNLWYLQLRGMGQESPYNRFWGQLARWLAGTDVRNRQQAGGVDALLNKSVYQWGESVHVRALVRDEKGDTTRYAQVGLTLKRVGEPKTNKGPNAAAETQQLPLNASEARAGMYEVTIPHPDKGDYVATLVATKEGKELGKQELKFTVIAPADEMFKLAANPKLMTDLARTHPKGLAKRLDQLPQLIESLCGQAGTITEQTETVPLDNALRALAAYAGTAPHWDRKYDLPTQALLVLVLLTGEWVMRRLWQLP